MSTKREKSIGIRGKFLIFYLTLVVCLVAFIGIAYYETTWASVYEIAKSNLLSLAEKNNQLVDQKLKMITQYSNGLMVDADLLAYLNRYQAADTPYSVFALDRPITAILKKYFMYTEDLVSLNILTSKMSYGPLNNTTVVPVQGFAQSNVRQLALDGKGKTVWVPTYHFFNEFHQDYIPIENDDYQLVFSAVKLIRLFPEDDAVVLVLNFSDRLFANVFDMTGNGLNGQFMVVTPQGQAIAHSDRSMITRTIDGAWLPTASSPKSGVRELPVNGQESILAYCTSSVTGWSACIIVGRTELMAGSLQRILWNIGTISAVFLAVLLVAIFYLTNGFLSPINALQKGLRSSGHGEFSVVVPETGVREIRRLIRRYNKMNSQIDSLIRDHYKMVILKREEELNVYNLQINPHFILNSMNLINLELLKNGQSELSAMACDLSSMMDYTLYTNSVIVSFGKDWAHTLCYMRVMSRRLKNEFVYSSDIDPEVLSVSVPKFLLQPLIENSIVHGFENAQGERSIHIEAKRTGDRCSFVITDNGKGLTQEEIACMLATEPTGWTKHDGGINNTRFRIKYLYGNDYDLKILSVPWVSTSIRIDLPTNPPVGNGEWRDPKAPLGSNSEL